MHQRELDPLFDHPASDTEWTEGNWHSLLQVLVDRGILTWREVAALTLGHVNPSQVGTSIASKAAFQRHFPTRKTWANVRLWHFNQCGRCADCGTRLELQADHMIPKEIVGEIGAQVATKFPQITDENMEEVRTELATELNAAMAQNEYATPSNDLRFAIITGLLAQLSNGNRDRGALAQIADHLDNMVLRCRRCNVIRRPSHANGGKTFLTAEAALMWLLLVKRPRTYDAFQKLCREYGLTMANIRFEEAWAMAIWLARAGLYTIDEGSRYVP